MLEREVGRGGSSPSNLCHSDLMAPSPSAESSTSRPGASAPSNISLLLPVDRRLKLHEEKVEMQRVGSTIRSNELFRLTIVGGAAFWTANFAISLTPIAAGYRAALSITYLPMLVESLVGGLIIGLFVSYFLLNSSGRTPTENPILRSVMLSFIALIIVTILFGVPSSFRTTSDGLYVFLIGALFNVLRILALGVVVGYLYKRLYGSA
jgi:hypothetical protein